MQKLLVKKFLVSSFLFLVSAICFLPSISEAQEIHQDLQGVWSARVVEIIDERIEEIPGTDTSATIQTLRVEILEGNRKQETVIFENDRLVLKVGQKFFLNYLITINGDELYSVRDVDRRGALMGLVVLFIAVVLAFGRMQGLRSLLSLAGSFLVIIYALVPLLMKGYPPILTSIGIGSLILFVAIFFTHGFNIKSLMAFSGTVISIALTGILAFVSIKFLSLSGFFSDETIYLNFSTSGTLNFEGLLLGGIIIGVLGVLDDIAITQVAVVAELKLAAEHLSKKEIFQKAMNIGKEHVSALVNTIVLAYAGVSLPLLLWFSQSDASFGTIVNNEIFATEIARTIVGSIGLIMTVPITTFLAVMFSHKYKTGDEISHSHNH